MYGSNRLILVALGLVFVASLVIGALTFPTSPTTQQFRYDGPRNENYRPGGGQCEPSALSAITGLKMRLRQTEDCQNKAEEYRQRSDDLIQQTRAANAAQAQANVASQQLWTGWLQTLGGFLTLAAAVAAAIFAERAAFHTKQSTASYRKREGADLVPGVGMNGQTFGAYVENLGGSTAAIHLHNLTIIEEKPVGPIAFFFPGVASITPVAVKSEGRFNLGQFQIPTGTGKAYFVCAIFYATVFGDAKLLPCLVEIDKASRRVTPLFDGDWSIWEVELEKFRRRQ